MQATTQQTQPSGPPPKQLPPEVQHLISVVMIVMLLLAAVMLLLGMFGIFRALRRHRERVRLMREHQEMPTNVGPDPWQVSAERLRVDEDVDEEGENEEGDDEPPEKDRPKK